MACQVSNGQFCCINSSLHAVDTSTSCSYTLFLQNNEKFCICSVRNQTQDEAININDNFWVISTLQNNKKLYITYLQYSYSTTLWFPYNIIYLPDGCEANNINFVLPSDNQLYSHSIMEAPENKLDFKRSCSKINNFSLMQSQNISSLTDDRLQNLANEIPEIKCVYFQYKQNINKT